MTIKVTCTISCKESICFELGYEDVRNIVSEMPDTTENITKFALLAKHPSSHVREAVASKDNLDEATVEALISDNVIEVLQALLGSRLARQYLSTEKLISVISRDATIAEYIAGYIECFDNANTDKLSSDLACHQDPRVRAALARNFGAPKKVVRSLVRDQDPKVQAEAKATVANY